jgi:hypothetical protein
MGGAEVRCAMAAADRAPATLKRPRGRYSWAGRKNARGALGVRIVYREVVTGWPTPVCGIEERSAVLCHRPWWAESLQPNASRAPPTATWAPSSKGSCALRRTHYHRLTLCGILLHGGSLLTDGAADAEFGSRAPSRLSVSTPPRRLAGTVLPACPKPPLGQAAPCAAGRDSHGKAQRQRFPASSALPRDSSVHRCCAAR